MRLTPIRGCAGYFVTKSGKVYSSRLNRLKLLKSFTDIGGYQRVVLYDKNGTRIHKFVHVLVLETFVSKKPKGFETRHLNGNPADNRLRNLKWGTKRQNELDRLKHGGVLKGSKSGNAILNELQVRIIKRCTDIDGPFLSECFRIATVVITDLQKPSPANWRHVISNNPEADFFAFLSKKRFVLNFLQFRIAKHCSDLPDSFMSSVFGLSDRSFYAMRTGETTHAKLGWDKFTVAGLAKQYGLI